MKLVVDSNILISSLDPKDIFYSECYPIFKHILVSDIEVVSPNIVLLETISVLRRRTNDEQLINQIQEDLLFIPSINWLDITLDVIQRACILSIKTGLKAVDAIISQVSDEYGIPLLTKDTEIKKKVSKTIFVFEPLELHF